MTLATRFVGNCQLCEGDFRLRDGRLVHHGYKRPGDGSIHGDCPGVGLPPYEATCEGIRAYVVSLRDQVAHEDEFRRQLEAGEIKKLTIQKGYGYNRKFVEIVASDSHEWRGEVRSRVSSTKHRIKRLQEAIVRAEQRIARWSPQPIRTFAEEAAKADKSRADRAAEVAARRDAQRAKRAAIDAKSAELEARRKVVRDSFVQRFQELGEKAPSRARDAEARDIWLDMRKQKNWSAVGYPQSLWINDVFIALGLAERMPSGFINFTYR
jgi:hypothetical protein